MKPFRQARQLHEQRLEAGFDQVALDQAARTGFDNGLFELSDDEAGEVLEEFYADSGVGVQDEQRQNTGKLSLKQKLENKAGAA